MDFKKFLQRDIGDYQFRDIIDNLTDEQIQQEVNSYLYFKIHSMIEFLKENKRYESGIDNIGFVYISQLEDAFKEIQELQTNGKIIQL